jgi:hypothetical protein
VAGSDTTSTALTVIIWHLLANPETMQKLTSEVCGTYGSVEDIKYQSPQSLPYLHAVIEEGLRICPPNRGLIPRVVVDRSPGNLVIGDHVFPPGVSRGKTLITKYPCDSHIVSFSLIYDANDSIVSLDRNRSLQHLSPPQLQILR